MLKYIYIILLNLCLLSPFLSYANTCKIETFDEPQEIIEEHFACGKYCEVFENYIVSKGLIGFVGGENKDVLLNNKATYIWGSDLSVIDGKDCETWLTVFPSSPNKNSTINLKSDFKQVSLIFVVDNQEKEILKGKSVNSLHIYQDETDTPLGFDDNYILNFDIKVEEIILEKLYTYPFLIAPDLNESLDRVRGVRKPYGFPKISINSLKELHLSGYNSDVGGEKYFDVGIIDVETKDGIKPDLHIKRGYLGDEFTGNINYNAFDNVYLKYNILTDLTEDIFTKDKEFFNANNIHRCYIEQKKEMEEATLQILQKYNISLCKEEIQIPQKPDNLE